MSTPCIRTAIAAIGLIVLAGCGGDEKREQSQKEALEGVLSSFGDQASNPKTLKVYFSDGKAPAEKDLKAYQNKSYMVTEEPKVEGGIVTACVKVTDEKDGKELGTFTWTFTRDGEKWKIESAPLQ